KGFGCTLAADRPDLGAATAISSDGNPFTAAPVPASDPALDAAMSRAFGDGLSAQKKKDLGTRAVVIVKNGALVAERYAQGFDIDQPSCGVEASK
ncbi:hypothetical protein ACC691_38395, partial [Rhizobium johnstonii]